MRSHCSYPESAESLLIYSGSTAIGNFEIGSSLWLTDIIDRAVDPPDPDIRTPKNLMFCAMHFPLAADATADNAAFVGEPLVQAQTLHQVMASRPDSPTPPEPNLTEDERRTIIPQCRSALSGHA